MSNYSDKNSKFISQEILISKNCQFQSSCCLCSISGILLSFQLCGSYLSVLECHFCIKTMITFLQKKNVSMCCHTYLKFLSTMFLSIVLLRRGYFSLTYFENCLLLCTFQSIIFLSLLPSLPSLPPSLPHNLSPFFLSLLSSFLTDCSAQKLYLSYDPGCTAGIHQFAFSF